MDPTPEHVYFNGGPLDGRSNTGAYPSVVDLDDGHGHFVTYVRTGRLTQDDDALVVYDFTPPPS